MSPDPAMAHSLPSSVSDTLEAMVGGGLDDLTLEDIDTASFTDEPSDVSTCIMIYIAMRSCTQLCTIVGTLSSACSNI